MIALQMTPLNCAGSACQRSGRPVRGMPAELVDCRGLEPPGDVDYA